MSNGGEAGPRPLAFAWGDKPRRIADPLAVALKCFKKFGQPVRRFDDMAASPADHDCDPNRISIKDIVAMNSAMETHLAHSRVRDLVDRPLGWLEALDPAWDMVGMSEQAWRQEGCEEAMSAALSEVWAAYRRAAVTSKLLHLKRPRLVPIIDSVILGKSKMGRGVRPTEAGCAVLLTSMIDVRDIGRGNVSVLRSIQSEVRRTVGLERSLCRILEVILWSGDWERARA